MFYKYSYLKKRKELLIRLFLDTLILLIPSILSTNIFFFSNNFIFKLTIYISWLIVNYVLGRYHFDKKPHFSFLKYLINSIIFLSIFILIANILSFFLLYPIKNLVIVNNYIVEKFILSILIQIIYLEKINYNNKNLQNLWFYVGDADKFNHLNEIIKDRRDINIVNDTIKLNSYLRNNESKFRGFLIEKTTDTKFIQNLNLEFNLNNAEQININSFCQNFLNKMPSNIINRKHLKYNSDNYNFQTRLKYISDIFISIILLAICLPIFLIVPILIKLEDQGPVFYSQIRVGQYGKHFKIWKFRSMKSNAEKDGPEWSKIGDRRITNIGRFLRVSRLDELPQLFCVLKGEMSLIGPRPERPEIENLLEKEIPYYSYRKLFKPGLSGWAQVNYPYGASINDAKEKLSYDIYYIENFSSIIDMIIFFKTIKLVFNLEGAIAKK